MIGLAKGEHTKQSVRIVRSHPLKLTSLNHTNPSPYINNIRGILAKTRAKVVLILAIH